MLSVYSTSPADWVTCKRFFLILAWVAQPWVTEGRKALSLQPGSSRWHPVSDWLKHLVIILSNAYLLLLFFCLFTQVHLLTDGSVEGQYITVGNGNEGVLHIPQIFQAGALPSDGIISYPGHSYPSAEDSTASDNWAGLRKGNIKREIESLLIEGQNNAIRTNYFKVKIDHTQQNNKCTLREKRHEIVNHMMCDLHKILSDFEIRMDHLISIRRQNKR